MKCDVNLRFPVSDSISNQLSSNSLAVLVQNTEPTAEVSLQRCCCNVNLLKKTKRKFGSGRKKHHSVDRPFYFGT